MVVGFAARLPLKKITGPGPCSDCYRPTQQSNGAADILRGHGACNAAHAETEALFPISMLYYVRVFYTIFLT